MTLLVVIVVREGDNRPDENLICAFTKGKTEKGDLKNMAFMVVPKQDC